MASYNELNALIDAYINRNGIQAITGQILNGVLKAMVEQLGRGYTIMGAAIPTTDPGTPDGPECYFASETGTYTDFDGLQVVPGELALLCYTPSDGWTKATIYEGFREVGATIDGNVGTPSVGVSYAGGVLSFDFHNMKGDPGQNGQDGQDGAAAGFGTIGADITGGVGTPGVSVESSGPATAKNLQFHFTNLKGETGVTSVVATVDNTTGTPACTVSLVGQQLTLAFTGLKGAQGDTGSSVDYPFTIVNNLTTDDATQALSAAQGVVLDGKVTQLEAKVTELEDVLDVEGTGDRVLAQGATNASYINYQTGATSSSSSNKSTDGIDVSEYRGRTIQYLQNVYTASSGTVGMAFYDSNDTFVSGVPCHFGGAEEGVEETTTVVPNNATYAKFSIFKDYADDFYVKALGNYHSVRIDEIEAQMTDLIFDTQTYSATDCTTGGYYDTSGTYAPKTITTASNFMTIRIPVLKGDAIHLVTKGGNNGRAYALTDANRLIYEVAPALADYTSGIDLVATKDGWLYVSNQTTNTNFSVQVARNTIEKLEDNVQVLDEVVSGIVENGEIKSEYTSADCVSGFYNTSGTYASNTITAASNLQTIKVPVLKGDRIHLYAMGANNGRAYALTDTDYLIYDVAGTSADYSDGIWLKATKDGWLYVTNMVSFTDFALTICTNAIRQLNEDVARIDSEVTEILNNELVTANYTDSDCIQGAFYNTSGNYAPVSTTELAGFNTMRVQVKKDDKIHLVCSGGNAGRAYALTDETLLIYSVAPAFADYSAGIDLTATKDGWLYVTNRPNLATLALSISYYKISRLDDLTKVEKSPMSISLIETIGVCGASYCNGAIFNGSTFIGEKRNISWGKILGRMCGIDVSIFAQGGSTTETWQTREPCLPALLAAEPLDMYILQLGTNDATYLQLGTIADIHDSDPSLNPNTYYGNWGKIIEQIKAHAPKAKIVMSKILTNYPSAAYNWSSEAIEEIADHYSIPYIETMDSDFLKSPWLNTNINENGGHPTALGYSGIAKAMKDLLEDVLQKYDTYFLDYAN